MGLASLWLSQCLKTRLLLSHIPWDTEVNNQWLKTHFFMWLSVFADNMEDSVMHLWPRIVIGTVKILEWWWWWWWWWWSTFTFCRNGFVFWDAAASPTLDLRRIQSVLLSFSFTLTAAQCSHTCYCRNSDGFVWMCRLTGAILCRSVIACFYSTTRKRSLWRSLRRHRHELSADRRHCQCRRRNCPA